MTSVPATVVAPEAGTTTPLRPAHAPAAAVLGACAAVLVAARVGVSGWDLVGAATASVLVWVAAIDLESRRIPNRIVLPATVALVLLAFVVAPGGGADHALAAAGAGAFLFVMRAIHPRGLGMGDVKLAAMLGALLGAAVLEALMLGFALAGLVGLALVARRGRVALKAQLPLAPFLAVGGIVALLLA